jgi:hypothetical protein
MEDDMVEVGLQRNQRSREWLKEGSATVVIYRGQIGVTRLVVMNGEEVRAMM